MLFPLIYNTFLLNKSIIWHADCWRLTAHYTILSYLYELKYTVLSLIIIKVLGKSNPNALTLPSFWAFDRYFLVTDDTVALSISNIAKISFFLTALFSPICRYIFLIFATQKYIEIAKQRTTPLYLNFFSI